MTSSLQHEPSFHHRPQFASGRHRLSWWCQLSLFSRSATGVELLFFDRENDSRPARVIRIDPALNRTYHYWHVFVPGVKPGQIYGYRAQGPFDPANGMGRRLRGHREWHFPKAEMAEKTRFWANWGTPRLPGFLPIFFGKQHSVRLA